MENLISWFEIPATDIDRAIKFYSTVLGVEIEKTEMGHLLYAVFPAREPVVGGALVQGDGYAPSVDGAVIYLNTGEDLNPTLAKVEDAGGKVVIAKTPIGPKDAFAHFIDSEGNRAGLYSKTKE